MVIVMFIDAVLSSVMEVPMLCMIMMPCSSASSSLSVALLLMLVIHMVMLILHAYVNIKPMCIIISSYYDLATFAFKFNQLLIQLEHLLAES